MTMRPSFQPVTMESDKRNDIGFFHQKTEIGFFLCRPKYKTEPAFTGGKQIKQEEKKWRTIKPPCGKKPQ